MYSRPKDMSAFFHVFSFFLPKGSCRANCRARAPSDLFSSPLIAIAKADWHCPIIVHTRWNSKPDMYITIQISMETSLKVRHALFNARRSGESQMPYRFSQITLHLLYSFSSSRHPFKVTGHSKSIITCFGILRDSAFVHTRPLTEPISLAWHRSRSCN